MEPDICGSFRVCLLITIENDDAYSIFWHQAFREILERKASAHPFENVQSLLPPNSWLGLYPIPGKKVLKLL